MDVTQPLLRPGGSTHIRLLVDDRVVLVDALNGTEPVARATPAYGEGRGNLGARRPEPHAIPIDGTRDLVGRHVEVAEIEDALADGETVVLAAGPGYGKTALLHHLGYRLPKRSNQYPDGAVLLSGRGRSVEDLLFEIFRACYEVPGRRPGIADLRRHLVEIKALLLVDDVADPVRLGRALADYAPYSRVVLATESEPVGRDAFTELVTGIDVRGIGFSGDDGHGGHEGDEDDGDWDGDDEVAFAAAPTRVEEPDEDEKDEKDEEGNGVEPSAEAEAVVESAAEGAVQDEVDAAVETGDIESADDFEEDEEDVSIESVVGSDDDEIVDDEASMEADAAERAADDAVDENTADGADITASAETDDVEREAVPVARPAQSSNNRSQRTKKAKPAEGSSGDHD